MLSRVDRLKKREARVIGKAKTKIAATGITPSKKGDRIAKRSIKKYGRINKKIVKAKARVEAKENSTRYAKKVVRKAVRKIKKAAKSK